MDNKLQYSFKGMENEATEFVKTYVRDHIPLVVDFDGLLHLGLISFVKDNDVIIQVNVKWLDDDAREAAVNSAQWPSVAEHMKTLKQQFEAKLRFPPEKEGDPAWDDLVGKAGMKHRLELSLGSAV